MHLRLVKSDRNGKNISIDETILRAAVDYAVRSAIGREKFGWNEEVLLGVPERMYAAKGVSDYMQRNTRLPYRLWVKNVADTFTPQSMYERFRDTAQKHPCLDCF